MTQYVALDLTGEDAVQPDNSLQVIGPLPTIAPQASSDDDMVALWLGNYRSPNTRARYAADASAFRAFTAKPLRHVNVRDIQEFAAGLTGLSDSTIAARLTGVKSLISLAHRLGYIPFDVGAPVQLPAIKDTLAERIMSEWDIQRMLGLERHPRNAAILRLLYSAGLRISELCGLRWRDLTARDDAGQLNVFGKGGKTRVILLPAPIWNRVAALQGNAGPDDAVFRSRQGGPLNRSQVHRIVKTAAKRAKLSGSVSAHYLRHSHASHALDRGAPVHVVQTTLGHASLTTTTRYSHARPGDSSARYLTA
jgi:site-specific recombinase XerD